MTSSVIISSWQRPGFLLTLCMPSNWMSPRKDIKWCLLTVGHTRIDGWWYCRDLSWFYKTVARRCWQIWRVQVNVCEGHILKFVTHFCLNLQTFWYFLWIVLWTVLRSSRRLECYSGLMIWPMKFILMKGNKNKIYKSNVLKQTESYTSAIILFIKITWSIQVWILPGIISIWIHMHDFKELTETKQTLISYTLQDLCSDLRGKQSTSSDSGKCSSTSLHLQGLIFGIPPPVQSRLLRLVVWAVGQWESSSYSPVGPQVVDFHHSNI